MSMGKRQRTKESATEDNIIAAIDAFGSERLRWLIGKGDILVQNGILNDERFQSLIDATVKDEIERYSIEQVLRTQPTTITKMSKILKIEKDCILWHLLAMIKWNRVEIVGVEKNEYVYALKES